MPRCKNCKQKFEPVRFNQKFCFDTECVKVWVSEAKDQNWKKTKKKMKAEIETVQELMKAAQIVFNKYIRERDKAQSCISCGKTINGVRHASHYLSSGGHSNVRYNEDNVWVSCYKCNVMLSGNQIEYRKRLINKIGSDRVEWLEKNGSLVKKWTRTELIELIKKYKEKIKQLEK
jgi:5-methylcytosine-specific restriction endonuclease McrA